MSEELEIAAADGLGELSKARGHAPKHGARCPNCDAVLKGAYCHACGQSADDHRRSFGHLCIEMVEDLFHLDGRLARTLPDLFLRPGRLAHDYIERKLARHVPPFRLFLVSLLVFMVIAEHEVQQATKALDGTDAVQKVALATQEGRVHASETMRAEAAAEKDQALKDAQNQLQKALAEKNSTPADAQAEYRQAVASANSEYQTVLAASEVILKGGAAPSVDFTKAGEATSGQAWMEWKRRFKRAVDDPELFLMSMFELGHRLAVLLLPILGFILALAFRSRPRLFVYDHMLVAMQVLSFQFLLFSGVMMLPAQVSDWGIGLALLWPSVNLYQTLRGAYGAGVGAAIIKTFAVGMVTMVAALGLLLLLLFLTVYGL